MKIISFQVRNFRALTGLELTDLSDTVVIAGPNGCGKSCALDAVRLLKSAYGGYGPNEWHSWFGEFQIDLNKSASELLQLFQNPTIPLSVSMNVALSDGERDYLRTNLHDLLYERIRAETGVGRRAIRPDSLIADQRSRSEALDRQVRQLGEPLLAALDQPSYRAQVTIEPGALPVAIESPVLELIFATYNPSQLGIIDYHGANRNYNREQLGGINLSLESNENKLRQHALYNYSSKYQNLKSEMAASYVRHLLAKQADASLKHDDSLTEVLKELFATFFPGKDFLGPHPTSDGKLLFPIRTANGAEHDIDDLSSGEKEVLYGYLRLRNSVPRNSVIMIDEPELHLNPRLVSGLASFYHRHLGRSFNNQIWLVTHSDTLIRESVGEKGFSVFHLQPAGATDNANQATRVGAGDALERCIVDLVGDMAVYTPGAKIVLFEGGGDTDFDVRMTSALFPQLRNRINPISGGSKRRVTDLYELLERAREAGHIPGRFYLVTDSDGILQPDPVPRMWSWPAYHIENYLLEPAFIKRVLDDISSTRRNLHTESDIDAALRTCAEETIPDMVAHELRRDCNTELLSCFDLKFDPSRRDTAAAVHESIARSKRRLDALMTERFTPNNLAQRAEQTARQAHQALATDAWRNRFRGRQILKRFRNAAGLSINYETFRDLILARMVDAEFQPIAMAKIVQAILAD